MKVMKTFEKHCGDNACEDGECADCGFNCCGEMMQIE